MATKKVAMSEKDFWAILGALNWKEAGDDDAVMAPAIEALAERPVVT